jgi:hypothetical protein
VAAITIYITPEEYAIGESNGISERRVYARVNYDNWSIERAITEPLKKNKYKILFDEWKPVCDKNGVSYETFRKRMAKKNMTPEKAAAKIPEPKITDEHKALAAQNGIPEGTLEQRVYSYRWDPMKAATDPVKTQFRRKGIVKHG